MNTGSDVVLTNNYDPLFDHTLRSDCPISKCTLMDSTCNNPTSTPHVKLGPAPDYALIGIRSNFLGYTDNLCVSCVISPLGRVDGVFIGANLPDFTKT